MDFLIDARIMPSFPVVVPFVGEFECSDGEVRVYVFFIEVDPAKGGITTPMRHHSGLYLAHIDGNKGKVLVRDEALTDLATTLSPVWHR